MRPNLLVTGILLAAFSATFSTVARADIYKHVRPDGSVVFTDTPPSLEDKLFMREDQAAPEAQRLGRKSPTEVWKDFAARIAAEKAIDPHLVRAVIRAESGENPMALSPKGAMGLMQLMPATAKELGVENPFSPHENVRGGVSYLAKLYKQFDGDLRLTLAAYNAGPGAVVKYKGVPPFYETQTFVERVLKYYRQSKEQS